MQGEFSLTLFTTEFVNFLFI
jgi:translation initiation factor 5A